MRRTPVFKGGDLVLMKPETGYKTGMVNQHGSIWKVLHRNVNGGYALRSLATGFELRSTNYLGLYLLGEQ